MAKKSRAALNQEIEEFILQKDGAGATYSQAEKDHIGQYSGIGGMKGAKGMGRLHEFYTPVWVAEQVWRLVNHHGYDGGPVLDPSIGTGNMVVPAPVGTKVTGFEVNPLAARITEIRVPDSTIHVNYFETAFMQQPLYRGRLPKFDTWLEDYPFSLVITNPPFGQHKNMYSGFFRNPKFRQVEYAFMYLSLKLLKKGGLMAFVTASSFMSTGMANWPFKEQLGKMAALENAFRLPPIFKHTQAPADILIFRKTTDT